MRKRVLVAGTSLLVLALATAAGAAKAGRADAPSNAPPSAASNTVQIETEMVERRTLEQAEEFMGVIGYGETFSLPAAPEGTVTWVPDPGTILRPGELLYRVDQEPAYWTTGAVPTYREITWGANGEDVEQLQRFLYGQGYLEDTAIDSEFGTQLHRAIKEWQNDHGLAKTGRIDASQLLFLPYEALRVATAQRVGEASGSGILEVTTADLYVTVETSAAKKRAFEGNPEIEIETADGSRYQATVRSITAVQAQESSGEQRFNIELDVNTPTGQEPGEATADVIQVLAADVVAVPVRALVALTDGGFAVEVVKPDGSTEYRAVEIGEFADGWVEAEGDIEVGDEIVVPS